MEFIIGHFMFNQSFPFQMEFIVMEGSFCLCAQLKDVQFLIVDTFRVSSNAYIPIFSYNSLYLKPTPIFSYIFSQTPTNSYKWEVEKILQAELRATK